MHVAIQKYRGLLEKILPGEGGSAPHPALTKAPQPRQRLDRIGRIFMQGCYTALEADTLNDLVPQLDQVETELRGFAYEGAGMGLTIFDHLTQWKMELLQEFVGGPGAPYIHTVYAGVGCGLARLRQPVDATLARLDPVLRWMVVDGYGFHEGFFWPRYIREQREPERISGYGLRAFDHGLGRAIWFTNAGEVQGIGVTIAAFPPARHSDLWSGIGLACAYAGAVERPVAEQLRREAGAYAAYVAMGIAVAARMRQLAQNPAPHTEVAAQVFWQMSADQVAALADDASADLPLSAVEPAYELWRQRIRTRCGEHIPC